jgi:hypothetical protein
MDLRNLALLLLIIPVARAADMAPGTGADPRLDPERAHRGYVGAAACGACHQKELGLWTGSHHDRAMQDATPESVLGDFADAELKVDGVTSLFFRRDGGFYVRTDGPDGELGDYPIRYTFGWYPLQQYLIEFGCGSFETTPCDQGSGG